MEEGYEHSDENDFADLDEWLCEYVDGTIDPIVREALEEYMQSNPALASHVESLMETRHILCNFGCKHKAPSRLQPLLRNRLENEIVQEAEPWLSKYNLPLATLATLSSIAAILLILASSSGSSATSVFSSSRLGSADVTASQNIQVPVWQASPAEQLYDFPIYSKFTHGDLTIVPAELRVPATFNSAFSDSLESGFYMGAMAP